ncbi:MAG: hypothetical protein EBU82_08495 [Flavobacteriia bacterium]|nr:hypothetical protein [Flavobacteriia bacterium]
MKWWVLGVQVPPLLPQRNTCKMETSAIKIQALWRGYKSRKGEVQPCPCCGYPMTIPPSLLILDPCSWCDYPPTKVCDSCKYWDCEGCRDGEPYISCYMCGSNCFETDFQKWHLCSRSCLVGPFRERW